MSLCTHRVSNCLVCTRVGGGCLRPAIAFPRNEQDAHNSTGQCLPKISTSRTASKTTGSQGNKCLTFWRWRTTSFSGVSQRGRTPQVSTEASALTSCVISTILPTCRLTVRFFAQQLVDLTHRWWSESEGPDIDGRDVYSLAAAAYVGIKLHSVRYPEPAHFSFQTPGSRPASSPTFSQLSLLFSAGASLTTFRLCTQPRQSTKLLPMIIASWSQCSGCWGLTHREIGHDSSKYASP